MISSYLNDKILFFFITKMISSLITLLVFICASIQQRSVIIHRQDTMFCHMRSMIRQFSLLACTVVTLSCHNGPSSDLVNQQFLTFLMYTAA